MNKNRCLQNLESVVQPLVSGCSSGLKSLGGFGSNFGAPKSPMIFQGETIFNGFQLYIVYSWIILNKSQLETLRVNLYFFYIITTPIKMNLELFYQIIPPIIHVTILTGWWFHFFFIIYGMSSFPTDFHIFQDGYCTTNQIMMIIYPII